MTKEKNEYDYSELEKIIEMEGYNQGTLAEKIGIKRSLLNQKLNNKTPFKQREILDIVSTLNIDSDKVKQVFFTLNVQKTEQI